MALLRKLLWIVIYLISTGKDCILKDSRSVSRGWAAKIVIIAVLGMTGLAAAYRSGKGEAVANPLPGVAIAHSPAKTRRYIGSPSLAILPGGSYVASHDFFGPGNGGARTVVYESGDKGVSWKQIAVVKRQFWSSLFVHQGDLYLMGTTGGISSLVIRRSKDGGRTWTTPKDATSGLLLPENHYHCAPVPLVIHAGRIWRAAEEYLGKDQRRRIFRAFVMSAPVDADLLLAESWTCSSRVDGNFAWLGGYFGSWLEGNAVVQRDGTLADVLRVNVWPGSKFTLWPRAKVDDASTREKAAILSLDREGKVLSFDPARDFIDFPGGGKKFTIRFDPKSGLYWSLANQVLKEHRSDNPERVRNTLSLISSPNLREWTVRSVILHHADTRRHAFQYVDWQFEGSDIILVSRTAYDDGEGGAKSQHDANYLTFHRVADFRALSAAEMH